MEAENLLGTTGTERGREEDEVERGKPDEQAEGLDQGSATYSPHYGSSPWRAWNQPSNLSLA